MKTLFLSFVIVGFTLLQVSCASKSISSGVSATNIDLNSAMQWDSKAVVTNKKTGKQQNLSLHLIGIRDEYVRLEATATMGYAVASIVSSKNNFKALIHPQKTAFTGEASRAAFERLIEIPLMPLETLNIAFEQPFSGPGWICQWAGGGQLSRCDNEEAGLTVEWTQRKQGAKLVLLKGRQFEMRWLFEASQSASALKATVFDLITPDGFKNIHIH